MTGGRRSSQGLLLTRCVVASVAVFALDVFLPQANLATFYPVLLAFHVMQEQPRAAWVPSLLMSVFTVAGYLLKPLGGLTFLERVHDARLMNRLLIVGALFAIASQARRLVELSDPFSAPNVSWKGAYSSDDTVFESAERSLLAAGAVLLSIVILAADLMTSTTVNTTLLLPVPFLLAAWSGGPRLARLLIPAAATLPFLELLLRFAVTPDTEVTPLYVVVNRALTAAAGIGFVWTLRRSATSVRTA